VRHFGNVIPRPVLQSRTLIALALTGCLIGYALKEPVAE
jgi:hypothetical protein